MATKDLKQQSNRIVQNRGAVQPAAHGKTVRPEGAEPVPRKAVPRVPSPAPKAQVKRNGEAGDSTAREAFGPPAVGSYHGRNQDGRLRVELGLQKYLVAGAIQEAVDASDNGDLRWNREHTYQSKGFDPQCPWNWTVVLKTEGTEDLVRATGLFHKATRPSSKPKALANSIASAPAPTQAAAPIKPEMPKKAGQKRSAEDYARELDRVQRELAGGLDPQVRPWFAERFLDISRATLHRKFPPIHAESSGSNEQAGKNVGARYIRYAELVAYRDARVVGGGVKGETDAGRQLVEEKGQ